MRDYTKIKAWQLADDLTVAVYELTKKFPMEEIYGITSQLRRAAYSVRANIVEGSSRDSKRDYLHFLYIARGSLSETRYFIHLSARLNYLKKEESNHLSGQTIETLSCLAGLIKAVEGEAGKFRKIAAVITAALAIALMRSVGGLRSMV